MTLKTNMVNRSGPRLTGPGPGLQAQAQAYRPRPRLIGPDPGLQAGPGAIFIRMKPNDFEYNYILCNHVNTLNLYFGDPNIVLVTVKWVLILYIWWQSCDTPPEDWLLSVAVSLKNGTILTESDSKYFPIVNMLANASITAHAAQFVSQCHTPQHHTPQRIETDLVICGLCQRMCCDFGCVQWHSTSAPVPNRESWEFIIHNSNLDETWGLYSQQIPQVSSRAIITESWIPTFPSWAGLRMGRHFSMYFTVDCWSFATSCSTRLSTTAFLQIKLVRYKNGPLLLTGVLDIKIHVTFSYIEGFMLFELGQ